MTGLDGNAHNWTLQLNKSLRDGNSARGSMRLETQRTLSLTHHPSVYRPSERISIPLPPKLQTEAGRKLQWSLKIANAPVSYEGFKRFALCGDFDSSASEGI